MYKKNRFRIDLKQLPIYVIVMALFLVLFYQFQDPSTKSHQFSNVKKEYHPSKFKVSVLGEDSTSDEITESEDAELDFDYLLYKPLTFYISTFINQLFFKEKKQSYIIKVPLYDLFCNWKYHPF